MTSTLEKNLQLLKFDTNTISSGLLFTNHQYNLTQVSFSALLLLEKANHLKAAAVYFRYSLDGRLAQPQLFIYDNTHNTLHEDDLIEIHKKLWSSDIIPLYYVIDRTQVRIFNARKPVTYQDGRLFVTPLETVALVAEAQNVYQRYSAQLFENGAFWEQPEHWRHFLYDESAGQKLIVGLKKFKSQFVKYDDITPDLAHKLLVQCILVKYLEERRDEKGNGVFEPDFFTQFGEATNFCQVIRKGYLAALFETLSKHFNGKIFELDYDDKKILYQADLTSLADFLDANLDDQQYTLWRLYAFNYLPVELISRIYEEFVPNRSDAVYTPIHLAHFMVDECMPLESPQANYKVIDVSCGSGIFLVMVFKRLVQWWQRERYMQTGQFERPDVERLKAILRQSIYGVDIEPDAVRLAVFSLSIALCDMLTPTEIWLNLKFNDLKEHNLYEGDFFEYLNRKETQNFDLVIGNPPFGFQKETIKQAIETYQLNISYTIPDHQIALLFLQQAINLLQLKGLLCLVVPAGPLIYNDTLDYRREFFSRYEIPQVIDFSALKSKSYLFESSVSTAVIFAHPQPPAADHQILHITVNRSAQAKAKRYFEIDHYDLHFIPQDIAVSDSLIWKTNLWGGGLLYYLVKRLMNSRTLGDYLEEKKKNKGWVYGEGYIVGNGSKFAPHLTNKPLLKVENFTEEGILKISVERQKRFVRTREGNKYIFEAPHLLIREIPGKKNFVTAYVEEYLVFKHQIIGIHTPWSEVEDLKQIERVLQDNYLLFKMFLLSFSSRAGIGRSLSTLLKKDFMALPYPEDETILNLSPNEQIIVQDMLDYSLDAYQKGERALVNTLQAIPKQLTRFGETFCRNLNTIYQVDDNEFYPLPLVGGINYFCMRFTYGSKNTPAQQNALRELDLSSLLAEEREASKYQRVVKVYAPNLVSLIKPKTLRYWLPSIALRDATEVMQDLVARGY